MYVRVRSCTTLGVDALLLDVEFDMVRGQPGLSMVGLPDATVRESRERVRSALVNNGFPYPAKRMTLNLAPADIPKEGSSLDFPIAAAILSASGLIPQSALDDSLLLGELALDGTLRPVHGALPASIAVKQNNLKRILLPADNAEEAAIVDGVDVFPIASLTEGVRLLSQGEFGSPLRINIDSLFDQSSQIEADFADVKGQEHVKRALEIAAAGGHNIVMMGPPGSGKTMLARRLPGILPPMSFQEALETTKIHSIHGTLPSDKPLIATRPFRSPHHSVSFAGLIGGGATPRPGEVSLGHHGVVFLDELPEFQRDVLEHLRQPLEDGTVTISRAKGTLSFPSRFMLVAAANPCPCGYFGDNRHSCSCSPNQIQRYISKLSGPLLDRIDIHIEVPSVSVDELHSRARGEPSSAIRERVKQARTLQQKRFGEEGSFCNAHMSSSSLTAHCPMEERTRTLLRDGIERLGLSARAYDRIIKVARTIADLAGSDIIRDEHICEAIQYRTLDRKLWMQ